MKQERFLIYLGWEHEIKNIKKESNFCNVWSIRMIMQGETIVKIKETRGSIINKRYGWNPFKCGSHFLCLKKTLIFYESCFWTEVESRMEPAVELKTLLHVASFAGRRNSLPQFLKETVETLLLNLCMSLLRFKGR